ncbi:MAG TPA: OmpA family protein, partial [Noviherbaspirillum sp.]
MPIKALRLCMDHPSAHHRHSRTFPKKYSNPPLQEAQYQSHKTSDSGKTMIKKLALGLLGACATSALAQTVSDIQANPTQSAYLQNSRGIVARNPFGLCWRSGYWTSVDAVVGCDGELVPPVVKPTAPAIAPPAAAAPIAPATPKRCDFAITFSSDETFAFDKTRLSNAAEKRINDEVLTKLASCAKVDMILVTGHTDRLGSQQYNQKLSEKRAEAVAAY